MSVKGANRSAASLHQGAIRATCRRRADAARQSGPRRRSHAHFSESAHQLSECLAKRRTPPLPPQRRGAIQCVPEIGGGARIPHTRAFEVVPKSPAHAKTHRDGRCVGAQAQGPSTAAHPKAPQGAKRDSTSTSRMSPQHAAVLSALTPQAWRLPTATCTCKIYTERGGTNSPWPAKCSES